MKFVIPVLIAICHLNGQCSAEHHSWSYEGHTGPYFWPTLYTTCIGSKQSPINLFTSAAKCSHNDKVQFKHYYTALKHPVITNNGHSVEVSGTVTSQVITKIEGHTDEYNFAQLHFHWGSSDSKGSEHTINGHPYPMEMHIVHTNVKYSKDHIHHHDGIAVVGVFFKISKSDNRDLKPLIDSFSKIAHEKTKRDLPSNSIKLSSFLPSDLNMYTYQGSLTTPECNEAVRWLVLSTPIAISESQLKKFRDLKIVNNFRPVQALDGRKVCQIHGTM